MGFVTEESSEYWYNFVTGQTSATEPASQEASAVVNDYGLKKVPQPKATGFTPNMITPHVYSIFSNTNIMHMYTGFTPNMISPRAALKKNNALVPELLAFKSWYNERGEKHYMDIIFKPEAGFHIIVQKDIAFDLPDILGTNT